MNQTLMTILSDTYNYFKSQGGYIDDQVYQVTGLPHSYLYEVSTNKNIRHGNSLMASVLWQFLADRGLLRPLNDLYHPNARTWVPGEHDQMPPKVERAWSVELNYGPRPVGRPRLSEEEKLARAKARAEARGEPWPPQKRSPGRPPMTEEEKRARAKAREEANMDPETLAQRRRVEEYERAFAAIGPGNPAFEAGYIFARAHPHTDSETSNRANPYDSDSQSMDRIAWNKGYATYFAQKRQAASGNQ